LFLWGALLLYRRFCAVDGGAVRHPLRGCGPSSSTKPPSSLAEADNRAKEERGVLYALGMGDAPERTLDGKARLMDLDEVQAV
jgi:hypothetical protein